MSAAAGRARMDVLVESQHRRQRILDFLNSNGPASVLQIAAATGVRRKLVMGTLALMRARHEVASSGAQLTVRYVALVATTVSAETMYAAIKESFTARRAEAKAAAVQKKAKLEPWRTVHVGGENPAIKHQGGQGSLRRTVHINCQQNY